MKRVGLVITANKEVPKVEEKVEKEVKTTSKATNTNKGKTKELKPDGE